MATDELIRIHPSGQMTSDGLDLVGWLGARAGLWRPVPAPPDLIMLERQELGEEGGQVALAGRITAPGDLTDVIQMIHASRWEGLLNILDGPTRKTVFIKEGDLVGAASNAPGDRLGEVLVRLGVITEAQREAGVVEGGKKKRLGALLVQRKIITPSDLYSALRTQVEEIFYSLLLLTDGVFWFVKQSLSKPVWGQLRLSTGGLLLEGVQRIDEMQFFREKIPSAKVIFEPVVPPPHVTLDHMEMTLLRLVDGSRDLATIARIARVTEFIATRAAFRLLQAGLVHIGAEDPLGRRGALLQRADVTEILTAMNAVLERISVDAARVERTSAILQSPETFYAAGTPYSVLFEFVRLDPEGHLEVEILLDNLYRARVPQERTFLYEGLSHFLAYVVFLICEGLPEAQEQQIRPHLMNILREEGMGGALPSG